MVVGNSTTLDGSDEEGAELRIYEIYNNLSVNNQPTVISLESEANINSIAWTEQGNFLYHDLYFETVPGGQSTYTDNYNLVRTNITSGLSELIYSNGSDPFTIMRLRDENLYLVEENGTDLLKINDLEGSAPTTSSVSLGLTGNWGLNANSMLSTHKIILNSDQDYFDREVDHKYYELSDHLGNVRSVFSDLKLSSLNSITGEPELFLAKVESGNNYYPCGMQMPGRSFSSSTGYRYGFNGMEKDDEVKGTGNSLDFGARIYDSRLGRFLSQDPLRKEFPFFSPYTFAGNSPILFIDRYGESPQNTMNPGEQYSSMWLMSRIGEFKTLNWEDWWDKGEIGYFDYLDIEKSINRVKQSYLGAKSTAKPWAARNVARYLEGKGGLDIYSVNTFQNSRKHRNMTNWTLIGIMKVIENATSNLDNNSSTVVQIRDVSKLYNIGPLYSDLIASLGEHTYRYQGEIHATKNESGIVELDGMIYVTMIDTYDWSINGGKANWYFDGAATHNDMILMQKFGAKDFYQRAYYSIKVSGTIENPIYGFEDSFDLENHYKERGKYQLPNDVEIINDFRN